MNLPHPAFKPLFCDELITDICFNGANQVSFDRGQGMESWANTPNTQDWNDWSLKQWIFEQLAAVGKSWDAKFPFIDAVFASGYRVHVAFPPAATTVLVSIRKFRQKMTSNPLWKGNSSAYETLAQAVKRKETVLLCGSTSCGKTTLLNELVSEISSPERIIALEEISELSPNHVQFLSLNTRPKNSDGLGEITLQDLLRQSLRMRPDRLILGECRGSEVLELLQSLNTGHQGSLATLHANSTRDALRRLELLCALSGKNLAPDAVRDLIASGIQWIAHLKRNPHHGRVIGEISQIVGREKDTILLRGVISKEA